MNISLSGIDGISLKDGLRESLTKTNPQVIGLASAFISISGLHEFIRIWRECGKPKCLLIAGTDNSITHPESLYIAKRLGWSVRLGKAANGIFHPKLIVAGDKLESEAAISDLRCVYVGSSNLTLGGLAKNLECGLMAEMEECPASAASSFNKLWECSLPATDEALKNYSAIFAERSRARKVVELEDLGVGETQKIVGKPADLRKQTPPQHPALDKDFAVAAWAGLQSFTGQYRFQVEFPKSAGHVVSKLIPPASRKAKHIEVYCPSDGQTRQMNYSFYRDNGMFRLNIPNDTPGVAWARENKDGVALIERGLAGGAPLRLTILEPGAELQEVVGHSAALGTWGRTTTRVYGWY